jgi:hypothetical protein
MYGGLTSKIAGLAMPFREPSPADKVSMTELKYSEKPGE